MTFYNSYYKKDTEGRETVEHSNETNADSYEFKWHEANWSTIGWQHIIKANQIKNSFLI